MFIAYLRRELGGDQPITNGTSHENIIIIIIIIIIPQYLGFISKHFPENPLPTTLYECFL
jgi:hypothetical protein